MDEQDVNDLFNIHMDELAELIDELDELSATVVATAVDLRAKAIKIQAQMRLIKGE